MPTSLSKRQRSSASTITGGDELYEADVVLEDGIRKLAVTKKVEVDSLSGRQESATNYFFVDSVADGQTLTINIPVTEGAPAFSDTFTVGVGETKKEFTDRIILELNQDFVNFQPYYKALDIDDNAAIFFLAKTIGEAGEDVTPNSFTLSGTVAWTLGFDNLQRRTSVVQASLSTKDPRLAIFGISGTVESRESSVEGLFEIQPYANGDPAQYAMNINASTGDVEFTFPMDALDDFFVTEIRFFGLDSGIQFQKFLGRNNALSNGILIEIKSDNEILTLSPIKTTEDFADKFAFGGGDNFSLYIQSGSDKFLASFTSVVFPLRRQGTFGAGNDDYIKIILRDALQQVTQLEAAVIGFRQEA